MAKQTKWGVDEPNMSDTGLLVTVEDLINRAMGPPDGNVINFKVMQTVLHILARQQRLLEQRVEIRIADLSPPRQKLKKEKVVHETSEGSSPAESPRTKAKMSKIKEEHETTKPDKALKEKEKAEKLAEKAERAASKEREKAERAASKEREKEEKAAAKEKAKAERAASKEREKEERAASKERAKEERAASKERGKAERAASKEREKEERAAAKERAKEERAASKEREKAERAASKEREKEERAASKDREKAEKQAQKEQTKAEKEREKAEKQAQKEQEKASKLSKKEQEKTEKERVKPEKAAQKEEEKAGKMSQKEKDKTEKSTKEKDVPKSPKKERKSSDTGIKVSDGKRGTEKVLVVEKGPTTRPESQSRSSIEVVTQSQFALLEAAVKELREMAVPKPLEMPSNEKLRSDLKRGSATLPDAMQAMQIDARVKAAEGAIDRMTGLLTALAAAGELPPDVSQRVDDIQAEHAAAEAQIEALKPSLGRKSVMIAPSTKLSQATLKSKQSPASSRPSTSIMKQPSSRPSVVTMEIGVSHDELDDAVKSLREELIKSMNTMTIRATATADNALHTAKSVADKVDIAMALDSRISALHSLALDYAEQLSGFDVGLATQMQSFKEQMTQMRGDLQSGLTQLECVNNNAETAAVTELTGRYEELVRELDSTLHHHRSLTKFQTQLADELRSLVECVELLREQKADRDEVADGLRDKADTSRLAGLLTESEFALARADLERRLAVCHDKFQRQDNVWMTAIKDLNKIVDTKSEVLELLSARDHLQRELRELHQRLQVLAAALGEPKAAVIKRQLAVGAACAACGGPALMSPRDETRGAPPRLPALRPPPAGAPADVCFKDWIPPEMPDNRHVCHRWCGGSHTLVSDSTRRGHAPPTLEQPATTRYTGYGTDGRLYMMEEDLQPCIECNEMPKNTDSVPPLDIGAGDHNPQQETVVNVHLTY